MINIPIISKNTQPASSPFEIINKAIEKGNPAESLTREERANLSSNLSSLVTFLLHLVTFATPLLILPMVTASIDTPKQNFLIVTSLLAVIFFLTKSVLDHKTSITRSLFDVPIILLFTTSIISAILSPNRITSLEAEPTLLFGLTLFFFLTTSNLVSQKSLLSLTRTLLFSLTVTAIWASVGPAATFFKLNISLPSIFLFNPTGSPLSLALLFVACLPTLLGYYLSLKNRGQRAFTLILLAMIFVGLATSVATLYKNRPILLDHNTGWRIATSTLGISPSSALFGIGPGHFIDAFTAGKSLDFNSSPYWNLRFSTSSNYFFYILTTLGIAGLASLMLLLSRFISLAKKRIDTEIATPFEKGLIASAAVTFLLFILFPAPTVLLFALFLILALLCSLYNSLEIKSLAQSQPNLLPQSATARLVLLITTLILTVGIYFQTGKLTLADYYFSRAIEAAQANRGTDTYNLQIKSLSLNPDNDAFRTAYSQTNLALANVIAGSPNLTDQQKQIVIQLVQQAIREGRLAASLEPRRSSDWENLSLVYRNLINFAQGADGWAIASQNQAIALDPTNPRLRLDLGGIYLAQKDYQSAGQIFAQAVNLKPDFANAHYNLAQAEKLLNLKDQAIQELQQTASLVCIGNSKSPDCQRIDAEIKDLGSTPASPGATPKTTTTIPPTGNIENASQSAGNKYLPKAKTQPPAVISTPSGEISR